MCDSDKNVWKVSTKDLDAWDPTLQACLARILDDSADATSVLDHLTRSIANTHISTGASVTRAAELLLGYLDIPPMRLRCFKPARVWFVDGTRENAGLVQLVSGLG